MVRRIRAITKNGTEIILAADVPDHEKDFAVRYPPHRSRIGHINFSDSESILIHLRPIKGIWRSSPIPYKLFPPFNVKIYTDVGEVYSYDTRTTLPIPTEHLLMGPSTKLLLKGTEIRLKLTR